MWIRKRKFTELKKRTAVIKKYINRRLSGYGKIYNSVHKANFNSEKQIELLTNEVISAKLNAAPSTLC